MRTPSQGLDRALLQLSEGTMLSGSSDLSFGLHAQDSPGDTDALASFQAELAEIKARLDAQAEEISRLK